MTIIKFVLVTLAITYAVLVVLMYMLQRQLQYHPTHSDPSPQSLGLANTERIVLPTPDGEKIVVWYTKAPASRPTILFFHGNGGELHNRAERFAYFQSQAFGFLGVEYRGYGASTGSISEAGLLVDAKTAYDFLLASGVQQQDVIVIGESLGTGIAVQLAAAMPVRALALEAPYASAVDVGASMYWFMPVRLVMKDQLRSIDYIARINTPLLITHGTADQVVPYEQGKKLYAAAREPKTLATVADQGHEILYNTETWKSELKFFAEALSITVAQ